VNVVIGDSRNARRNCTGSNRLMKNVDLVVAARSVLEKASGNHAEYPTGNVWEPVLFVVTRL
jgi:hypothetical protein